MQVSQTLKNNKLRAENHASYRSKNEFYGNKDMFTKNCKKSRFVTNPHITLVRSTILEDTPVTRHPKSASSKLTDVLLTWVRMRFLEKSTFLQDLTQTHPWAANTHETNEIIRILMEKGCPTAPQASGLPSKNDPKTLEVLQKWIFEENAWCIQSKILLAA